MDHNRLLFLAGLSEGYSVRSPIDTEEFPNRESQGLEGPFRTNSGLVVYYDTKAGKYYNPKTDMYLEVDEYQQHNESESKMNYNRMRELAGLDRKVEIVKAVESTQPEAIAEAEDYQSPEKLYGLYVGLRGSGKLGLEFTGTREECSFEWHESVKRNYKRGEATFKIVRISDDAPTVINESFIKDELTPESRCENCAGPIDPTFYHRESSGFICDKCGEGRYAPEFYEPTVESVQPQDEKSKPKFKVPADVTAAINSRITELKQSIAQYNEKGYDDGGVKTNAIEALEQIAANLKLEDGLTKANVFYGTLMSPITDLLPPKVVKFLHEKPKSAKLSEGLHDKMYYIYSISSGDGSKIYCSTADGERATWAANEVNQQLRLFNRGAKAVWHAEEARVHYDDRGGEDRPGPGFERYSDDTAERDGPEYDDQFGP